MKNLYIALLMMGLLAHTGCKGSRIDKSQFIETIELASNCDYDGRKTQSKIKNLVVKVIKEGSNIILLNDFHRYVACNLKEEDLPLNDTILIFGLKKELYPNEFMVGHPIKITSAFKKK